MPTPSKPPTAIPNNDRPKWHVPAAIAAIVILLIGAYALGNSGDNGGSDKENAAKQVHCDKFNKDTGKGQYVNDENKCVEKTDTVAPTTMVPATPTTVVTPTPTTTVAAGGFRTPVLATSQPDPILGQRISLGADMNNGNNIFRGYQVDLTKLSDLKAGQWYVAHGDVAGNGSCGVRFWTTGKPQQGELSVATWKLEVITGPSEQALMDNVAVEQSIAGGVDACPATKVR